MTNEERKLYEKYDKELKQIQKAMAEQWTIIDSVERVNEIE